MQRFAYFFKFHLFLTVLGLHCCSDFPCGGKPGLLCIACYGAQASIPRTKKPSGYSPWDHKESGTTEQLTLFLLWSTHELEGKQVSVFAALGLGICCSRALAHRLSGCGVCTQWLCHTWDLSRSRIKHVSPELADRFFTTEPPGKNCIDLSVLSIAIFIQNKLKQLLSNF